MYKLSDAYWNNKLADECRTKDLLHVQLMMSRLPNDWQWNWNRGLGAACYAGHLDTAEFMIEKGATLFDLGVKYARDGGHLAIIKLLISKGAKGPKQWDN